MIRDAHIDDVYAISDVFAKSWKYAYKGIIEHEYLENIKSTHWVDFLLSGINNNEIECIVLRYNDEVIGAGVTRENNKNILEIVCLYLLPCHIGKGYGKMLLDYICLNANKKYNSVTLTVLNNNISAINFYMYNGFKDTGKIEKINLGNDEIECIIMQKQL